MSVDCCPATCASHPVSKGAEQGELQSASTNCAQELEAAQFAQLDRNFSGQLIVVHIPASSCQHNASSFSTDCVQMRQVGKLAQQPIVLQLLAQRVSRELRLLRQQQADCLQTRSTGEKSQFSRNRSRQIIVLQLPARRVSRATCASPSTDRSPPFARTSNQAYNCWSLLRLPNSLGRGHQLSRVQLSAARGSD